MNNIWTQTPDGLKAKLGNMTVVLEECYTDYAVVFYDDKNICTMVAEDVFTDMSDAQLEAERIVKLLGLELEKIDG